MTWDPSNPPPRPPGKLWKPRLADILAWYEANLCGVQLLDPRGNRVRFAIERFPHMIKLLDAARGIDVKNPQKVVEQIRKGELSNADFGGYQVERAQTLPWIPTLVTEPSSIWEVENRSLWSKPGDTLIVKDFDKTGYQSKVLVCRQIGTNLLVPITSHPLDKKVGKAYKQVWP